MSNYAYVAVDPSGAELRGTLEVGDTTEAVRRIKEMGLFPTRIFAADRGKSRKTGTLGRIRALPLRRERRRGWFLTRIKSARLCVFTRQLATLTEAGLPLLRGLRILEEQEQNARLNRIIGDLGLAIESGSSLAEAVAAHPRVFNTLYVSMVKAGEMGGALEVTLTRLAEFMEKGQRIKGRIKAAMFYPCAVLTVAAAIMGVLMTFVVPRFQEVFTGLLEGRPLPAFTRFVFGLSNGIVHHFWMLPLAGAVIAVPAMLFMKTACGRLWFDRFKLVMPLLGNVFRKAAISRFARTLGTLVSNGVPILPALTVVKETAGNVAVAEVVSLLHENVKQGDPLAPTLKSSTIFPAMVAGMVDVGEQTGALPEMLLKVAETYDEEVTNAANALTSLLEPLMIVILAVLVGSIVVAMFLPLLSILTTFDAGPPARGAE